MKNQIQDIQALVSQYNSGKTNLMAQILIHPTTKASIHTAVSKSHARHLHADDIEQEIVMGILEKIHTYDPAKATWPTFVTRLGKWKMLSAIREQDRDVSIPDHVHKTSQKIRKAERRLYQTLERDPTYREISERTGLDIEKIKTTKEHMELPGVHLRETEHKDGIIEQWETLVSTFARPDKSFIPGGLGWEETLEGLDDRERRVVEMLYFQDRTVEEVAKFLGVTTGQARRIRKSTLAKLKKIIR